MISHLDQEVVLADVRSTDDVVTAAQRLRPVRLQHLVTSANGLWLHGSSCRLRIAPATHRISEVRTSSSSAPPPSAVLRPVRRRIAGELRYLPAILPSSSGTGLSTLRPGTQPLLRGQAPTSTHGQKFLREIPAAMCPSDARLAQACGAALSSSPFAPPGAVPVQCELRSPGVHAGGCVFALGGPRFPDTRPIGMWGSARCLSQN